MSFLEYVVWAVFGVGCVLLYVCFVGVVRPVGQALIAKENDSSLALSRVALARERMEAAEAELIEFYGGDPDGSGYIETRCRDFVWEREDAYRMSPSHLRISIEERRQNKRAENA